MVCLIDAPKKFIDVNESLSPSMDEAATKEELRPVKKQLVSTVALEAVLFADIWCRNN